ncbi:MAG: large subunit ribosomal protein [Candidatus Atribacteria bacterium]|jgi:large subunit ribosomal protein L23|nr:large subunit ribosomal protein [Candidatus Atribacteria bacterium]
MSVDREIIIHPIITEKAVKLQEENKYVFKVNPKATKSEIKKAVQEMFGVTVLKVNTVNVPSKKKRLGRFEGRTASWKKAIVYVKPGERIKAFDIS